jgi:hypothetical protein
VAVFNVHTLLLLLIPAFSKEIQPGLGEACIVGGHLQLSQIVLLEIIQQDTAAELYVIKSHHHFLPIVLYIQIMLMSMVVASSAQIAVHQSNLRHP